MNSAIVDDIGYSVLLPTHRLLVFMTTMTQYLLSFKEQYCCLRNRSTSCTQINVQLNNEITGQVHVPATFQTCTLRSTQFESKMRISSLLNEDFVVPTHHS
jgi:hypothetical protein